MTRKHLHVLLAVVVGLILTILIVENTDDSTPEAKGLPLLPGFSENANDAKQVRVVFKDAQAITIRRDGEKWVIDARNDYPADVGQLRQLFIALAEARIIEEKTSKPELYEKLGVDDPEDDGGGTKVYLEGDGFSYAVVLGNTVPGDRRYARLADVGISYLIDKNPSVPKSAGDWLLPTIIDIPSDRIRKASIAHADGETIVIEKNSGDLTDFSVLAVPEGRELSYATVGNGIAGALRTLELDDVRKAADGDVATTAVFDTWDGLRVTAAISSENDESWVAFHAEDLPIEADVIEADVDASNDSDADLATPADTFESAGAINERLNGWQYRLPDHKTNLLVRRWDDILKSAEEGS